MCRLSMKLSDKFDPNQMYTSDREPKGQGHCKQQNHRQGNKSISPLNKQSKAMLGNCSAKDESNRL